MDLRLMGIDTPILNTIHHILENEEYPSQKPTSGAESYVRDARAMARTPADVKEYPNSYQFIIDMPGLKSGDIKVQIEDDNVLVISGERKREEEKEGVRYLKMVKETKDKIWRTYFMERRVGKFMRKFALPENANVDNITAVSQDGVLFVSVQKLPPPQPKIPKTIQVKAA